MRFQSLMLLFLCAAAMPCAAAEKPNFVWILSEDNSKHYLKLYDEQGAETPRIAQLAADGVLFEHAFSCSPVCSVARTTLITGCYAPRVGTQFHRKLKTVPLPEGLRMFPAYLRQAGYYTTNNSKKDYNAVEDRGVWDESSNNATWRNRPDGKTPFFHMQTFTMSHESSLHFQELNPDDVQTSPDSVSVPPYFPNSALFRYTVARYHDRIRVIDDAVGKIVDHLKQDGLLEDTFIFYFGDHGGVLPRSKGYIYESGLHVPLVVRIPEKWKQLVPLSRGSRAEGFVSFVDFGPTLLHLAGVEVPAPMDGRPFLGAGVTAESLRARDEAFGYADRFDEKYDLCRSLRKGPYKYIRNYQAFYPHGLRNNYRYRMLAYQEWELLDRLDRLNAVQRRFFESKPVEALYNIDEDPHEIRNLAADAGHADVLAEMRARLQQRVKSLPDLSFYPESHLVDHAFDNPAAFGRAHAREIARLVEIADFSLLAFEDAEEKLRAALRSENPWERYWGLIACSCFGEEAAALVPMAKRRLQDPELLVQARAAEFLGIAGAMDPRPALYAALNATTSPAEALLMLNTAVYFHDGDPAYPFELEKLKLRVKSGEVSRRIEYLQQVSPSK